MRLATISVRRDLAVSHVRSFLAAHADRRMSAMHGHGNPRCLRPRAHGGAVCPTHRAGRTVACRSSSTTSASATPATCRSGRTVTSTTRRRVRAKRSRPPTAQRAPMRSRRPERRPRLQQALPRWPVAGGRWPVAGGRWRGVWRGCVRAAWSTPPPRAASLSITPFVCRAIQIQATLWRPAAEAADRLTHVRPHAAAGDRAWRHPWHAEVALSARELRSHAERSALGPSAPFRLRKQKRRYAAARSHGRGPAAALPLTRASSLARRADADTNGATRGGPLAAPPIRLAR